MSEKEHPVHEDIETVEEYLGEGLAQGNGNNAAPTSNNEGVQPMRLANDNGEGLAQEDSETSTAVSRDNTGQPTHFVDTFGEGPAQEDSETCSKRLSQDKLNDLLEQIRSPEFGAEITEESLSLRNHQRSTHDEAWNRSLPHEGKREIKLNRDDCPKKCLSNVIVVLRHHPDFKGTFAFNELTQRTEKVRTTPWSSQTCVVSDSDLAQIRAKLERILCFTSSIDYVESSLVVVSNENRFDPLKDHVNGLKYDGVCRLDTWLSVYLGVEDTPYTREVGKRFLISAIARALEPGCKVDTCLIFEGKQGVGKSTAVQILGGEFFCDLQFDPRNKDTLQNMVGRWFVELGELDGLSRADISASKRFISSANDVYRSPYARHSNEVPRRSVFVGTVNEAEYLNDETGARRFWPVEVKLVDTEGLRRDRDALLAEAREAYLAGEPWHLTDPNIIAEANEQTSKRQHEDVWVEKIGEWIDNHGNGSKTDGGFTLTTILERALGLDTPKQNKAEQMRAARALRKLGYRKVRVLLNETGRQATLWKPKCEQ